MNVSSNRLGVIEGAAHAGPKAGSFRVRRSRQPDAPGSLRRLPWLVLGTCLLACGSRTASGQSADRVSVAGGAGVSGKVVAVTPAGVEVQTSDGQTQQVGLDAIREVQFGGEPQSLRNARGLLLRGRGVEAREEVAKIEKDDLEGADPLVLAEIDFVRAAADARAAIDSGGDLAAAARTVSGYLAKHAGSHHFFPMQELLGDLLARSGNADGALAAYRQLETGPPAVKVRATAARAGLLLGQGKVDDALAEYDAAIALAGTEESAKSQRRTAVLGRARCLSAKGKADDAIALVLEIVNEADPEERELLARAYGVLGATYQAMGGKDQDALIQYLTIDLVYNTLPDAHAEALFRLGELWEKGNHPERAREARQTLKASYPSSPWTAKLQGTKP
jgi:tetratricopeptide (TPR) repeat protein